MRQDATVWIGFDPREAAAFAVARSSVRRNLTAPIPVRGLVLDDLIAKELYWRPTERRLGRLWDVISQAPMSTEFAISRFLTPHLAKTGWALFMDCDVLIRTSLARLFEGLDESKAVYCVKHDHKPSEERKMDGQIQTVYPRKNWSSVCVFNASHPANAALTPDVVNTLPGRDLHAFCWLKDSEIGELGPEWNWLVGESDKSIDPKIAHFTSGGPWLESFRDAEYADEWIAELNRWAS